jgi:hypothetical protein
MNWFKSSYCSDVSCVEVAKIDEGSVGLRDSKHPEQPFLRFSRAEWVAFMEGIKAGDFGGC